MFVREAVENKQAVLHPGGRKCLTDYSRNNRINILGSILGNGEK